MAGLLWPRRRVRAGGPGAGGPGLLHPSQTRARPRPAHWLGDREKRMRARGGAGMQLHLPVTSRRREGPAQGHTAGRSHFAASQVGNKKRGGRGPAQVGQPLPSRGPAVSVPSSAPSPVPLCDRGWGSGEPGPVGMAGQRVGPPLSLPHRPPQLWVPGL